MQKARGRRYGDGVTIRLAWVDDGRSAGSGRWTNRLALSAPTGRGSRSTSSIGTTRPWTGRFSTGLVPRSTWDYPQRLPEFLAWLDRVDAVSQVLNPVPIIRWSLDKHYLAELAVAGVPVTPTVFVEPGGWPASRTADFVVKPAIGAGSRDAAAYGPEQQALAFDRRPATACAGRARCSCNRSSRRWPTTGEWPAALLPRPSSATPPASELHSPGPASSTIFSLPRSTPSTRRPRAGRCGAVGGRRGLRQIRHSRLRPRRPGERRRRPALVLEVELVEPSLFLPWAGAAAVDRMVAAFTD